VAQCGLGRIEQNEDGLDAWVDVSEKGAKRKPDCKFRFVRDESASMPLLLISSQFVVCQRRTSLSERERNLSSSQRAQVGPPISTQLDRALGFIREEERDNRGARFRDIELPDARDFIFGAVKLALQAEILSQRSSGDVFSRRVDKKIIFL
jgi:hypothetical protein